MGKEYTFPTQRNANYPHAGRFLLAGRGCSLPIAWQLIFNSLTTWNSLPPVELPASTFPYLDNVPEHGGMNLSKSCL